MQTFEREKEPSARNGLRQQTTTPRLRGQAVSKAVAAAVTGGRREINASPPAASDGGSYTAPAEILTLGAVRREMPQNVKHILRIGAELARNFFRLFFTAAAQNFFDVAL